MGLIESLKSALLLTDSAMPKDDPIKKQAQLLPDTLILAIFSASASEESNFPSGVKMQNQAFFGIFSVIDTASFSNPAAISAGEGESDKRASGSSIILNLQKPRKRFWYSSEAVM